MEKKGYLVCIDSDGCAINSMNCKHIECFGPAILQIWNVETGREELLERWNQINLFSATRGVNRFIGLGIILDEFHMEPEKSIQEFKLWTETTPELSNQALMKISEREGNTVFTRALKWSLCVNERIGRLPIPEPFAAAKECINKIHRLADISVVSSANREAIFKEWGEGGLLDQTEYVFSQNEGSKTECIRKMKGSGYETKRILMVGDAPGDYQAAAVNGVWFYPILAGREEESWERLGQVYFDLFIQDRFEESIQQELKVEMDCLLEH